MDQEDNKKRDEEENEESLRLENDIMKLKLQAEFGAKFGEMSSDVPPELEQEFLKQVYDFEKAWENQQASTVNELLGKPTFQPLEQVPVKDLATAFKSVMEIYSEKGISVDFQHEYPLAEKYRFVTEELPVHETMFVNMPGMVLGFLYEEFHPNHAGDMEERVSNFLEGWFAQDVEKCVFAISEVLILDNGVLLPKEKLIEKLTQLFDSFEKFDETDYFIAETSYDKQELENADEQFALGFVEGGVKWNGVMENGETVGFSGAFKFYLELVNDYWTIMFFHLPGWKWQQG